MRGGRGWPGSTQGQAKPDPAGQRLLAERDRRQCKYGELHIRSRRSKSEHSSGRKGQYLCQLMRTPRQRPHRLCPSERRLGLIGLACFPRGLVDDRAKSFGLLLGDAKLPTTRMAEASRAFFELSARLEEPVFARVFYRVSASACYASPLDFPANPPAVNGPSSVSMRGKGGNLLHSYNPKDMVSCLTAAAVSPAVALARRNVQAPRPA